MGVIYDKARGVPQDDVEALKWYRLAAEKGYVQSQFNLGVFLVTGCGTSRNEEEGWNWIHKAAAGGNENARAALACYRKGCLLIRTLSILLPGISTVRNGSKTDIRHSSCKQ